MPKKSYMCISLKYETHTCICIWPHFSICNLYIVKKILKHCFNYYVYQSRDSIRGFVCPLFSYVVHLLWFNEKVQPAPAFLTFLVDTIIHSCIYCFKFHIISFRWCPHTARTRRTSTFVQVNEAEGCECKFNPEEKIKSSITLYGSDLQTLNDEQLLNDRIIDLIISHVDNLYETVHSFSCHFFTRMKYDMDTAYKWLPRRIDLKKKSFLFFPRHTPGHWHLNVVDIKAKTIYCLDSLYQDQRGHSECVTTVKTLLTKHSEFFSEFLHISPFESFPQQKGCTDCGIFTLAYAFCLAANRGFDFSQRDVPALRAIFKYVILSMP